MFFLSQEVNPATQQKIAVLTCQLRKSEAGRKTYEVATEKLLQFVEVMIYIGLCYKNHLLSNVGYKSYNKVSCCY